MSVLHVVKLGTVFKTAASLASGGALAYTTHKTGADATNCAVIGFAGGLFVHAYFDKWVDVFKSLKL